MTLQALFLHQNNQTCGWCGKSPSNPGSTTMAMTSSSLVVTTTAHLSSWPRSIVTQFSSLWPSFGPPLSANLGTC